MGGERKNFGFVTFGTQAAFDAAVKHGFIAVGNSEITIRPAAESSDAADGSRSHKGFGKGGPHSPKGKGYAAETYDPWDPWGGYKGKSKVDPYGWESKGKKGADPYGWNGKGGPGKGKDWGKLW